MRTKLITLATTFVISTVLVGSGCKSAPAPAPAEPSAQGSTSSSGAAAPATPAVQPATAAADAAAPAGAPAPRSSRATAAAPAVAGPAVADAAGASSSPTASSSAPAPRRLLTAPAGSRAAVTLTETLKASTSNVGDGFTGVLAEPIVARGGETVFPRGTRVAGTVVAAKGRGRFKGAGALGIQLTSVGGVRVTSSEYEKSEKGKGKRTGALVGGGAGLGAIIGGLAGGGKGALIGGLAGAGAGGAGAAYTGSHDVVIPSESLVTFRLLNAVSR